MLEAALKGLDRCLPLLTASIAAGVRMGPRSAATTEWRAGAHRLHSRLLQPRGDCLSDDNWRHQQWRYPCPDDRERRAPLWAGDPFASALEWLSNNSSPYTLALDAGFCRRNRLYVAGTSRKHQCWIISAQTYSPSLRPMMSGTCCCAMCSHGRTGANVMASRPRPL